MPPVAGNKGQGPLTLVVRGLDALTIAFNVIGTMLIVALMVLIGADVAGRGLFNAPISGVPELVTLSIVVIVFLQIPQTMRAGRLTRSDAILEAVRSRAPRASSSWARWRPKNPLPPRTVTTLPARDISALRVMICRFLSPLDKR